jgi:predicted porin
MKTLQKFIAGAAVAAAFATSGYFAMARAADLGTNAVGDLEERVAELEASTARKGNRKVSLTVYGAINYALLYADFDGTNRTTITGNPDSQSRFGFKGSARIGQGIVAGYVLEVGVGTGAGNILTGKGVNGVADNDLTIRHSAVWLEREGFGKLWLGKTSVATDGIAEISLANINGATMLSLEPLSGTYLAGNGLPFDGGRADVVKFETATFYGFTASASWSSGNGPGFISGSTGESKDIAIRYMGEGAGFRSAAGAGYRENSNNSKVVVGSASLMHIDTGLFVNAAAGDINGSVSTGGSLNAIPFALTLTDPKAYHVQAGVERNWFGIGKTTVFAEYMHFETSGFDTKGWGGGFNQEIANAAMDVYVTARNYDDFNTKVVTFGGKIRF